MLETLIFFTSLILLIALCFKDGVKIAKTHKNRDMIGRFVKKSQKRALKMKIRKNRVIRYIPVKELGEVTKYIKMVDYQNEVYYV